MPTPLCVLYMSTAPPPPRAREHIQAWRKMSVDLKSPLSPMSKFLMHLAMAYIVDMNLVLAYSPTSSPDALRVELDSAQYKVDRVQGVKLFSRAWNVAVTTQGVPELVISTFAWEEWKWVYNWLRQAVKRTIAHAVRTQFSQDEDVVDGNDVYVGDKADGHHAYYCVGAVWRSIMRWFSKSVRICSVINELFLDKETATKNGLPTNEVTSKYVVVIVLFACSNSVFVCML